VAVTRAAGVAAMGPADSAPAAVPCATEEPRADAAAGAARIRYISNKFQLMIAFL